MRLSRQTREIIKVILFVIAVAIVVTIYIVYPMGRVKAQFGRAETDRRDDVKVAVNNAANWAEAGLSTDTFTVAVDNLTTLACLYVPPRTSETALRPPRGTVFLLHADGCNRDSLLAWAGDFADSGYSVVAYDQRASGGSTGSYRGEGEYEADDLAELISWLDLRGKLFHPCLVVGFETGADAAILAAREDDRVDRVAAVRPYLTTKRLQNLLRQRYDSYWFPFYRSIMWFWYGIRSSYSATYRDVEQLRAVACPTLAFFDTAALSDREVQRWRELSADSLLTIAPVPADEAALLSQVASFAGAAAANR